MSRRIVSVFIIALLGLFYTDVSAQMKYSTKSKKAIRHFEEALKFYNSGRGSEAIEVLKKAIKADENFVEAHAVSGDCYFDIGNLKSAIIEYQKVVDIDPDFLATSYKQLADTQFKTGDYKSALANYKIFMTKKRPGMSQMNPQTMDASNIRFESPPQMAMMSSFRARSSQALRVVTRFKARCLLLIASPLFRCTRPEPTLQSTELQLPMPRLM